MAWATLMFCRSMLRARYMGQNEKKKRSNETQLRGMGFGEIWKKNVRLLKGKKKRTSGKSCKIKVKKKWRMWYEARLAL